MAIRYISVIYTISQWSNFIRESYQFLGNERYACVSKWSEQLVLETAGHRGSVTGQTRGHRPARKEVRTVCPMIGELLSADEKRALREASRQSSVSAANGGDGPRGRAIGRTHEEGRPRRQRTRWATDLWEMRDAERWAKEDRKARRRAQRARREAVQRPFQGGSPGTGRRA